MAEEQRGWRKWAYKGAAKGLAISDYVGARANKVGAAMGTERFWPTSGDYAAELDKCERILRTFCVEGLPVEEEVTTDPANPATAPKKKRKVYRKIPPKVIQEAKGICIFTAFRTGFAPFAGAGGGGVVLARMKDGTWSAPSFVSPNNMSVGFMLGIDVYNAILILRTEEAVKGFRTHHVTLGAELAVAAGPLGYGISGETGLKSVKAAPIFSYVLSKGFYAGVEMVGQVFVDRFDENERVYHWPGIKAGDIFDGKARRPYESDKLYKALHDAELGIAQGAALEWNTEEVYTLELGDGETLKLPPTPEQLSIFEGQGIQDEEDVQREKEEKAFVKTLPPPPKHPHAKNYRARASDISVLEGRKALRSPEPGLSASACNSPNLDTEVDGTFRSPTRSERASPMNSPPRSLYDYEEEIKRLSLGPDKGKSAEVAEPAPHSIPLPPDAAEPTMIPAAEPEHASTSAPEVAPQHESLTIPVPPPLQHHDTSTSSISMYSAQEEEPVPPPYNPNDAVVPPPEKQAEESSESNRAS